MKRFILRALLFLTICVAIFGGVCALEIAAEIRKYHEEIIAPEGASILVCNDSQTGNGVDSVAYPEFFNFSAHGRTLDQAYLTCIDALKYNPGKIKTIVFDVSPAAAVWSLDDPFPKMSFPAKYWLLHYLHPDENIRDLSTGLVTIRDNMVGRRLRHFWRAVRGVLEFHSSLNGGFTPMHGCDKESFPVRYWGLMAGKVDSCRGLESLTLDSPFVVRVLDPVLELARDRQVKIIFISTPWNEDLRKKIGEVPLANFTRVMREFAATRQCRYEDFLRTHLDASCWGDGNHLNDKGAREFTKMLRQSVCHGNRRGD